MAHNLLNNNYFLLQLPTAVEEWLATAKQFQDYWNFLNCGGAIDGKHYPHPLQTQPPTIIIIIKDNSY